MSTEGVTSMNRTIRSTILATGAVMLGALGLTQAAQAHTDVTFSIGVPAYVEPVYVAPAPVYVPQRTYVERTYVNPAPVYATRYVYEREREREWRREEWRREQWRRWHEHREGYYGRY
jgi:hypothetical protein